MKALVAHTSKRGSTKGIADFIGEKLRQRGLDVDVLELVKSEIPELRILACSAAPYIWIIEASGES